MDEQSWGAAYDTVPVKTVDKNKVLNFISLGYTEGQILFAGEFLLTLFILSVNLFVMIDNANMTFQERLTYLAKCPPAEWEALCKRCGICCLVKVAIGENGGTAYLNMACDKLDADTKKCKDYDNRLKSPRCCKVDLKLVLKGELVPASCGYVEFLYGPAMFPATIDLKKLRPFKKLVKCTPMETISMVIPESLLWNRRRGR